MDVLGWRCSQFSSSSSLINIIYWPWPLRGLRRDGRRNLQVSISQSALEKGSVNVVMWQPNKSGECQRQKGITIRSDSSQKPLAHLKLTAPDLVTGSWCNANATPSFARSLSHWLSHSVSDSSRCAWYVANQQRVTAEGQYGPLLLHCSTEEPFF